MELNLVSALELVKTHLGGYWEEVFTTDIDFTKLQGISNSTMYTIQDKSGKVKEYSKILVRFVGNPENDTIGRLSDTYQAVVAFKMSELGHGPQLLSLIQNGRIEEFVPSRRLNSNDLDNPSIVEQIAYKVAIYHGMHNFLPVSKKPRDVFVTIRKNTVNWSTNLLKETLEEKLTDDQKVSINFGLLLKFDFETELQWISEKRKHAQSPLIHAHYDLNTGNILIRDTPDRHGHHVMLVDYEGACLEQRGFDLATHFNFHYTDSAKPNFMSGRGYPTIEYRRNFIAKYLDQWQKQNKLDNNIDTIDHILWETDVNAPLHALFLLSFWLVPGDFTLKNPTFLHTFTLLGQAMLKNYFDQKEMVCKKLEKSQ